MSVKPVIASIWTEAEQSLHSVRTASIIHKSSCRPCCSRDRCLCNVDWYKLLVESWLRQVNGPTAGDTSWTKLCTPPLWQALTSHWQVCVTHMSRLLMWSYLAVDEYMLINSFWLKLYSLYHSVGSLDRVVLASIILLIHFCGHPMKECDTS